MSEKLSFRTHINLKDIIGKDLINNDNIAVLELVKNSFDAGSTKVDIVFNNLKENKDNDSNFNQLNKSKYSKIFIKDYGTGMSLSDIKDKWFNIAYSEKKHNKNQNGRFAAGEKGVGRFSCDRLGQHLDIYTKQKDSPIIHFWIDWRKFEDLQSILDNNKDILRIEDIDISSVEIDFDSISDEKFEEKFKEKIEHGTFIEISKLRSSWATLNNKKAKWETDKILDLRRYLEKLINPNQMFSAKPFIVNLDVPEFVIEDTLAGNNKINGIIENKVFEELHFRTTVIESTISSDGKYIETVLKNNNKEVFSIIELNPDYNLLKDIKIVEYYLNPYSKAYFTKQTGIRSGDFGSVFLFINGFRVNPLGDVGNDWLSLEIRKGQGYARYLGTREVVGRIEINDQYSNYKIVSNREGIVQDEKFKQLIDIKPQNYGGFFYKTHKRLEKYVVDGLDWEKVKEKISDINNRIVKNEKWEYDPSKEKYEDSNHHLIKKNKSILDIIYSAIMQDAKPEDIVSIHINEELFINLQEERDTKAQRKLEEFAEEFGLDLIDRNELIKKEKELSGKQEEIEKLIKEKEKEKEARIEQEKEKKRLEEENRKQQEALEIEKQKNTFLFATRKEGADELRALIHNIKINVQDVKENAESMLKKALNGSLQKDYMLRKLNSIKLYSEKVLKLSKMITKAGFNTEAATQDFNVPKYIKQYIDTYYKKQESIDVEVDGYDGFDFWIKESILEFSIVLDNLISNAKKFNANKLNISFEAIGDASFDILISDNGDGLVKNFINAPDKIFDLGVTSSNGSGIGLYMTRNILKNMNASINFVGNEKKLKGASFIISFKRG